MSDQSRCSRCNDWWEPQDHHDFQHLEERKVEALELIAASLYDGSVHDPRCDCVVIKSPHRLRAHYIPQPLTDALRDWDDQIMVALGAGLTPDPRCDCTVIKRPHGLRDHYVPEPLS